MEEGDLGPSLRATNCSATIRVHGVKELITSSTSLARLRVGCFCPAAGLAARGVSLDVITNGVDRSISTETKKQKRMIQLG